MFYGGAIFTWDERGRAQYWRGCCIVPPSANPGLKVYRSAKISQDFFKLIYRAD